MVHISPVSPLLLSVTLSLSVGCASQMSPHISNKELEKYMQQRREYMQYRSELNSTPISEKNKNSLKTSGMQSQNFPLPIQASLPATHTFDLPPVIDVPEKTKLPEAVGQAKSYYSGFLDNISKAIWTPLLPDLKLDSVDFQGPKILLWKDDLFSDFMGGHSTLHIKPKLNGSFMAEYKLTY
jgi:hypothetical protein